MMQKLGLPCHLQLIKVVFMKSAISDSLKERFQIGSFSKPPAQKSIAANMTAKKGMCLTFAILYDDGAATPPPHAVAVLSTTVKPFAVAKLNDLDRWFDGFDLVRRPVVANFVTPCSGEFR